MLSALLRRFGLTGTTVLITIASIAASVGVTTAIMALWLGGPNQVAITLSIIVPGLCAPVFTFVQLRLVVELQRTREELRRLSITDGLTKAANRRHFIELSEHELARALRYALEFSLVIIDLDDFKALNDRYGHVAGDVVLQGISDICRSAIRATDAFGRLGGEEFALLLPNTGRVGAGEIAARIRRDIAAAEHSWRGEAVRVTASLGVAEFTERIARLEEILELADRALYTAKWAGKNQTVVAMVGADGAVTFDTVVLGAMPPASETGNAVASVPANAAVVTDGSRAERR